VGHLGTKPVTSHPQADMARCLRSDMEPDKWDPHVTNPLLSLFLPQRVSLHLAAHPVGAEEAPVAARPAGGGGAPTVAGVEVVADGRGGSGRGGGGRGWQTCSCRTLIGGGMVRELEL
jgi:hypothetical protein